MCGIVGMIGWNGMKAARSVIEPMTASLLHRGPDEEGNYLSGPVGFGFRRLAILDLSPAAHQPMVSEDGMLVLVFNGEIYNYVELREELRMLGHKFKSSGDTEVLLKAYSQWGAECLHKLNGMWAFLIYDRRNGVVFGSRDRFGVKPLYLYRHNDCILFASEPKAIRASGLYQGESNWATISKYLLQGRLDDGSDTFYSKIDQIPAGTGFEVDLHGGLRQWRYWSLDNLQHVAVDDPISEFALLFEDAVRLRMRSDVPVGISLSGGLDSTSIICAAARLKSPSNNGRNERLMAFSYIAPEFDESSYIMDTLEQTGAQLKQLHTSPLELWSDLRKVLWFHDEPVHSFSALIGFQLMRLASSNSVRVVLTGQGADEQIAGYATYFTYYWQSLLRSGRVREVWREVSSYAHVHRVNPWKLLLRQLRRLLQSELHRVPIYHRLAARKGRMQDRLNRWFAPALAEHLAPEEGDPIDETLTNALISSVERAPLPLYLRIEDRNSMAHSVEARLPFLDYRLASLCIALPNNWKVRGSWNKYILREAMHNRIPESVRIRPDKFGFPTPAKEWFTGPFEEPVQDLLSSQSVRERGIYKIEAIRKDIDLHKQRKLDISGRLFDIVQFELWSELNKGPVERPISVAAASERPICVPQNSPFPYNKPI